MKKIKFRAWDESRCKMIFDFTDDFNIDPSGYTLIFNEDKELFCGNYLDNGDWQEPKLEQFTGLTDKNDKDIYEGDIVLPKYNYLRSINVKFKDGVFNISRYDVKHCVIIGNIHENMELLK